MAAGAGAGIGAGAGFGAGFAAATGSADMVPPFPTTEVGFAGRESSARQAPATPAQAGAGGAPRAGWATMLEAEVAQMLAAQSARGGEPPSASDVMDRLTRTFESTIIRTALRHTRGRRIDAALRLGIGRNTITRKIQDLRLEED
jgi:two-component system nitrogen regulation response regulator GlnG